ncbi:putative mRNA-binding ribosome synthesis protein [Clavispora lusitaniae]|uniref:mRNA-binding ribosome synthesis protein n=1 Tax=Clavispora lusitaniae TaxID=36911 RepID=A0AA91PVN9_CLALS|nr:putative mRNA-binding ribosome synthesis protein [Clavispora lusitaniae]
MAKASKATKKFQNKHLKHTLEHRREIQKHNKKIAQRKKTPSKVDKDAEPKESKSTKPIFQDMSVEEFFEGGFEVPKPKKGAVVNENSEDEEMESSSDEEESSVEESASSKSSQEDSEEEASDDEATMKQNLKQLEEKDPEFYKYLQKNDKNLLDFEGVNPMDAMSDDEDEEDEEDGEEQTEKREDEEKADDKKYEITRAMVAKWNKQLKTPTIKLVQNVISAFKAAVYINSADENNTRFVINDPSVFSELMFVCLKRVPEAVKTLAPYKVNSKGIRIVDSKNPNTTRVGSLMKSQGGAFITLLNDITNTETAALVLTSLQEVLPFYISQRKIIKQILNAVVECWATTTDVETQVATYAFLNNAAREFPKSTLDIILKSTYSSFLRNCRKTNVHTMDLINFSKNSAVELFGIDEQLSYQVGFEYIRQLAIHLRNTITNTTNSSEAQKDAYKAIYNWQFCHSLDFWSRVLSHFCNPELELVSHKNQESPLRSLIYPLVQVTLGTIRLIPTAQFFPLRFYLIRSLIRLSQGTGVYIPIYPLISEILSSTAFSKPGKPTKLQALDFDFIIKASQQYLGTKVYQDGLFEQFLELTSEFFVLYCKNIAFPELVTPAILSLRRFIKKSKNLKFNKQLQQLIDKLNANATFITTRRANVEYGPSNKAEVQLFLKDEAWDSTPLGQYVVVHRKVREERMRLLKEAILEEENAKNNANDGMDLEDAIESGDESEEGSDDEVDGDDDDEE